MYYTRLLGETPNTPSFPHTSSSNKEHLNMRKRNIHIQFWLDKAEAQAFDKKVKRSGLSREAYLRHLVAGVVPNDAPPPDYYSMMRELHGIGNNLNQIAQKAHILNVLDVQRYDDNVRLFERAVKTITDAVILPRPFD